MNSNRRGHAEKAQQTIHGKELMQAAQAKHLLRQANKQGITGPIALRAVAEAMGLRVVDVMALVKQTGKK
jgi:hypothetical protein